MRTVSFLIKPASGRCNLACRYCFYRDETERREQRDFGIMSEETADRLIDRAFELEADTLVFAFQGGEPTIAGLPFFRHFTSRVREKAAARLKNRAVSIQFSLQTNGVALDSGWARFFRQEAFLLGVSLDGPRLIHDAHRVRRDNSGTHSAVLKGIEALRVEHVPANALCVVDAATADNAGVVYRHLRSRGFEWIQFIPCLDPLGEEPGGHPWSLTPEAYARFLKETFDLRYAEWRAGVAVSVRWFDNLVSMAMGFPPESCGMSGSCSVNFTIEADGSVYPCDFYVLDEWRIGNVRSDTFASMRGSDTARRFVAGSLEIDEACRTCAAFPLCRGGCRRDREPFTGRALVANRYCPAFRDFFSYAGKRIKEMAEREKTNRPVGACG